MEYGIAIDAAVKAYQDNSARSVQSQEGRLGPSDIGFCRNKAALMIKGVEQTDSTNMWAAAVGTSVHNYVEAAIKEMFPEWLLGSIDDLRVTATLPSGAEISGHPDIVIPNANTVLDIKTVDGFAWVKREGTNQSHKYQRHLYAMGCLASGLFDKNKPIYVGNVYFDRSGKEGSTYTVVEELDPTLTNEIDSWVTDVTYAVTHSEDASRDIPAAVCEKICSYFTACRGELETNEGTVLIDDPELLAAVNMYVDGRDMSKEGEQLKKAAQSVLSGINGSTGSYQVRWVDVNPTRVDSFDKAGYSRMDVRKVRK